MNAPKKLSLVIPCYNEATRGRLTNNDLSKRLQKLKSLVAGKVENVIFVNDGSRDTTSAEIKMFIGANKLENSWFVIDEKINKGKGHALLVGMEKAAKISDFVGYLDADLSVSVKKMCNLPLKKNTVYYGYRIYTKKQSFGRATLSILAKLATKIATGVKVKDTQCPLKIVPSDAFLAIRNNLKGYKWIYDIELLWELQEYGCEMKEVPVLFHNMDETTLKVVPALRKSAIDLVDFCNQKLEKKRRV